MDDREGTLFNDTVGMPGMFGRVLCEAYSQHRLWEGFIHCTHRSYSWHCGAAQRMRVVLVISTEQLSQ